MRSPLYPDQHQNQNQNQDRDRDRDREMTGVDGHALVGRPKIG